MTKTLAILALVHSTLFIHSIEAQQCHFRQVSSKSGHALGISEDGKLYGWGSNIQGQIGIGVVTQFEPTPILVNQDADWKKVETGNSASFSASLKQDGSLWFMGNSAWNVDADFSNNTTYLLPTSITPTFSWKDFSAGYFRIIGIQNDNTMWAWGNNDGGCLGIAGNNSQVNSPTQVGTGNNWSKVSCGLFHSLALKSNGTIWACGYNNVGQLGNGSSGNGIYSDVFIQVGTDNDWSEILACAAFNLALKSDGTLWAWGNNETGQLGDGTTINKLLPTQIGTDTDWKSLGYSGYSSAAIKANGTLWTWGLGAQGQLGNGSTSGAIIPTQVGTDTDWKIVTGGGGYGFAGTTGDHYLALKQSNELFTWGANQTGALGNNTTANVNVPTSICNTVGSKDIADVEYIKIFPNPTNSTINIGSNVQIKNLKILNVFGQVVKCQENATQVDVSDLRNGIYSMIMETPDNRFIQKEFFVVK